jgi:hypothetical protein
MADMPMTHASKVSMAAGGNSDPTKLQVRESSKRGVYIGGLTAPEVSTPAQVHELLNSGRSRGLPIDWAGSLPIDWLVRSLLTGLVRSLLLG